MQLNIIDQTGDLQERYEFYFILDASPTTFRLNGYTVYARLTPRHKWRKGDGWSIYAGRWDNTIPKPDVPPHILVEAKKLACELIQKAEFRG